jgi:type I restriction enzyme M protein
MPANAEQSLQAGVSHIPLRACNPGRHPRSRAVDQMRLVLPEIARIADDYHAWRAKKGVGKDADAPSFCKSATIEDVRKHGHVLTPGRYVDAEAQENDGEPFAAKMKRLTATLRQQKAEAAKLDAAIAASLEELGYGW